MITPTTLSIVVVNYNQAGLLRECLTSVFRTLPPLDGQVVVFDNGSEDGSRQMLEDSFPQVQVIASEQNLGFARANNLAIRACLGQYLVLLNNDTVVLDNAFQLLLEFMEQHPGVACAGPQLLNPDGSVQPSCMPFPSLWRSVWNFVLASSGKTAKYVPPPGEDHAYVDAVTGACLMLRRQALSEVGLLDEGYFMYAEETDWCYRARQAGWHTAHYPASKVIHLGGQTASTQPVRFYVERRYSRVRFFLKHRGLTSARIADWMIRLSILARWFLASGEKRAHYGHILAYYNERIEELF